MAEFSTQNIDAVKSNLFNEFSSLSDALKTAQVEPQFQPIRLSFSVRSVGLTLFECISRVLEQIPEANFPIHCYFRVRSSNNV